MSINMPNAVINMTKWLSSLKLTFVLLVLLLVVILIAYNFALSYVVLLALPLSFLSLNLVAAIITNKTFQKSFPLLLFHLTLLATVILVSLSQLTFLEGHVEVIEGEEFSGQLDEQKQGVFHQYNLPQYAFTNLAVQFDFTPNVSVTAKRSRVQVNDPAGSYEMVIGEHKPLIINNYRFYTTGNSGYSALFSWQAHRLEENNGVQRKAEKITGAINFPAFLEHNFNQTNEWLIPNTDITLWIMLQPEEDILKEEIPMQLTPPENHQMIVRVGQQRRTLQVGQKLNLPEGELTYHGLRVWMGYKIHYDPYKAYMLMTSILTVLFLAWFFWRKFNNKSWLSSTY
jgi:cytochrome c biogenesis protein